LKAFLPCVKSSAWPGVELRLCPWLQLSKLNRVGLPEVFFCLHYVHSISDDGQLAFRNLHKSCYTEEKDSA
jgi:hypothetical protein